MSQYPLKQTTKRVHAIRSSWLICIFVAVVCASKAIHSKALAKKKKKGKSSFRYDILSYPASVDDSDKLEL